MGRSMKSFAAFLGGDANIEEGKRKTDRLELHFVKKNKMFSGKVGKGEGNKCCCIMLA
jgi:hypothetical protein